jgi:prolyl-tRNA synthetase
MAALGADGEDRLAQHALSIRCLQRPDGSLAESGDAEDDLVAVVARSY